MNFEGKVVLVTGSSRSLGKQIVSDFAKNGASVVINYNNSYDEAVNLKSEIGLKYGVPVLLIKCDVSKEDEVISMIDEIISKFGRIDVLVNNAGICNDSLFESKTRDDFISVFDVNLIGTYLVSKYASKSMIDNKNGRIINISSDNAFNWGYPESCDYDSSKAAVISLTHNMAKHYAPYINVNAVCPGWIDTDMNKNLTSEQKKDIESSILLKRFADVSEISNVILFLASDLSNYVNDSVIVVNGGRL